MYFKFLLISLIWAATFPIAKHIGLNGVGVIEISFYQCFLCSFFMISLRGLSTIRTDLASIEFKLLGFLALLRNVFGTLVLNYLISISQSVSQVTIALLLIPFLTLLIDCIGFGYKPNMIQKYGIFLSAICVLFIILNFNLDAKKTIYFLPLILLSSSAFAIEALVIAKSKSSADQILFWQNSIAAVFLYLIITINNHHNFLFFMSVNEKMVHLIILMSLMVLLAGDFFIKLTRTQGASVGIQIKLMAVIFSCFYDAYVLGAVSLLHNLLPVLLAGISAQLILQHSNTKKYVV